ncbi:MAG: glucose-6-phosphate isomerase [Candidatus Binatia bacterium]
MAIRVDVNGALEPWLGAAGLAERDLEALGPRVAEVHEALEGDRRGGGQRFRELPYQKRDLSRVQAVADEMRAEFDTLVVIGIGGPALGVRALTGALCSPFAELRPGSDRGARVLVTDSIDPSTVSAILDEVDPHKTAFNVISKSGDTAETMSQFLIVRDRLLKQLGGVDYAKHVVITTGAEAGGLRQIVNDEGFRSLAMPDGVPARYAILSPVGLFPAAMAGIEIADVIAGAQAMDERCKAATLDMNPAYLHGAVQHLMRAARAKSVRVTMPYSDRVVGVAEWFAQLWAESLGKDLDLDGRVVHSGQTVVTAVGPAAQHSQLQLYVEGPDDKVVTFVRVEDLGPKVEIPEGYGDLAEVGYLGKRTLGELLNLEQRATEIALAKRGRATTTIHLPAVNAFTIGQLVYLLEVETVFVAALARVDPFTAAGIEEGKRLTYAMAGRRGYDDGKAEVESWMQKKNPRFVV